MLLAEKPIAEITGRWLRGKKRPVIVNPTQFYNARRADPDFDLFVKEHIPRANARAQALRGSIYRTRKVTAQRRDQANDYHVISAMVPANLPPDVRDDIAQSIFMALLEGSLRRDQVKERVRQSVTAHNREANRSGVGKYGLVSLDAPIFADNSMSLSDTITRGLWD
jgi:hypothetical protein